MRQQSFLHRSEAGASGRVGVSAHLGALLLAALGATALSFDSLLVRLAHTDSWNVVFWRGFFMALSLGVVSLLSGRLRSLRGHGRVAAGSAVLSALASSLFVFAVLHTKVANAVVILSAAPLWAAIFTRVFLREQVPLRTWVAIVLAMVGMLLVFAGSMGGGGVLGDLFALCSATAIGANFTLLRRHPRLDRMPLVAAGGAVAMLLALPMAQPLGLSWQSYAVLAVMGGLQMPLAMVLLNNATRYLPSAEVALFLLVETILGTVWVWWLLGEQPPEATLLGGMLIILTLAGHAALGLHKRH